MVVNGKSRKEDKSFFVFATTGVFFMGLEMLYLQIVTKGDDLTRVEVLIQLWDECKNYLKNIGLSFVIYHEFLLKVPEYIRTLRHF